MPLIETAATIDSACISTAPVFEKRSSTGRKTKDGAPKETDQGWWALFVHNKNGARPEGGLVQTLLWSVWLVAFASTWFIPDDRFYHFLGAVCGLVLLGALIPDDGSTVLPYYLHVILPIMAFKSAISSATFGGHWSFSLFYFVFGVIPLADYIIGVDVANQTREVGAATLRDIHMQGEQLKGIAADQQRARGLVPRRRRTQRAHLVQSWLVSPLSYVPGAHAV